MDLGIAGKAAIVTGGSMGIGKAIAMSLASEGVNVAICARGVEQLEASAKEIRAATGGRVLAVKADMTVPEEIKGLVTSTAEEFKGIDILVNNAVSSDAGGSITELPDATWHNNITTKVMGYVRCTREVVPYMKARRWGRIVNIGGMAARIAGRSFTSGVVTAAITNLTKNLSNELTPQGILVNNIHPGSVRTPRLQHIWSEIGRRRNLTLEEVEQQSVGRILIGRILDPEDIANLVLFLVSDKAGGITGESIAVDGGEGRGVVY